MKKKEAFRLTALAAAMLVVLPCLAEGGLSAEPTVVGPKGQLVTANVSNELPVNITEGNGEREGLPAHRYGIFVNAGAEGIFSGDNISIDFAADTGNASARGAAAAGDGAKLTLGEKGKTESIVIHARNTATEGDRNSAYGIMAQKKGQISVAARNLDIAVSSEKGQVTGILSQGSETSLNGTKVTIDADNITIRAESREGTAVGIGAMSGGEVEIKGNLDVAAKNAIAARGGSKIAINEGAEGKTVKLKGDIAYIYDGPSSGTPVDADVIVNLDGAGSSWEGNARVSWNVGDGREPVEGDLHVSGLAVNLSNGAQWTPNVIEDEGEAGDNNGTRYAGINNLGMNKGIINMATPGQTVKVGTLSGQGGTINAAARVTDEGKVETAQLQVNQIARDNAPTLAANLTGVTADDVIKDTSALKNVVRTNVDDNETATSGEGGGKLTYTTKAAEGDVIGELAQTVTLDEAGEVIDDSGVKESKNSVTAGLQKIAAMNYLTFRAQTNDVSKRMGDLRSMPQSDGMWGRVVAGQSEYKGIHNTYQTLQIGADKRIGNYYLGATASYTDGDGSLKNGSTDDKNYGLGLYGGWMGEDGQYVDVIIKRQKFESDFDLYNLAGKKTTGSYDTWGTSASVEYGWRLGIDNTGYYVEPQAELMFGHLNGVGYKTSNGVHVKQDGIDSAVGRAGLAAGWVSPDKTGSAYVKASVLHDWEGDADTRTSKDGVSRSYTEEMGGTWGEFAVGGTFNITKNLAAYGEVETTVGNPVRTTYQVSGGIRYSF